MGVLGAGIGAARSGSTVRYKHGGRECGEGEDEGGSLLSALSAGPGPTGRRAAKVALRREGTAAAGATDLVPSSPLTHQGTEHSTLRCGRALHWSWDWGRLAALVRGHRLRRHPPGGQVGVVDPPSAPAMHWQKPIWHQRVRQAVVVELLGLAAAGRLWAGEGGWRRWGPCRSSGSPRGWVQGGAAGAAGCGATWGIPVVLGDASAKPARSMSIRRTGRPGSGTDLTSRVCVGCG